MPNPTSRSRITERLVSSDTGGVPRAVINNDVYDQKLLHADCI